MRATHPMTYNPAFLDEAGLLASFAVRGRDLAAILEIIHENTGPSNQHIVVIGPRGIGKTTLALRVAAELRQEPSRAGGVYPIVFAEESYEVHDTATLWLQALYHLGRQTGVARWQEAYERLRGDAEADRVRSLALAELHEFAEAEDKRLLLVVENFNDLLDRKITGDDAWTMRHTLLNDASIMLLATATSRFDGIDHPDQAMFDLFRVHPLDPLASHECATLWHHLTERTIDERQGRALEILTGGNPRLLTILSRIVADAPLHALADDLTRLIDDQTAYFKSQIDALAPQEQRVFVALAEIWSPAIAQEIATRTRLSVNAVSAVLARLERHGLVTADSTSPRRKRYQLTERLYNIYYQMRRGGAAAERVRYSVEFIAAYYDAETLVEKLLVLAEDTVAQPPAQRLESILAFFGLYDRIAVSHAGLLLPRLSPHFLDLPELSPEQRGRLDEDRHRARVDQAWFFDTWRLWWDSHPVLRESWHLISEQPVAGASWTELFRSMQGEAPPNEVGLRIGERIPSILIELEQVRPSLHELCRTLIHKGEASWVDLLVVGILAAAWFDDEPLLRSALKLASARWPESPWVALARLCLGIIAGEPIAKILAKIRALLGRHPDSVWLPLVAGLFFELHDDPPQASALYASSPVSKRLPEIARTLVEIHDDFLEHEAEIVLQPRFAKFAGMLEEAQWIGFFTWLGRFTNDRLERSEDAVEVLRVAAGHFPSSLQLQLALGSALFHSQERADEGLTMLRRASKYHTDAWQLTAAIATVQAHPLGDPAAALRNFTVSWHAHVAAREGGHKPSARTWLEPVSAMLPGHRLLRQFLALHDLDSAKLEADLKRLLPHKGSREQRQALILVVMAMAVRGEVAPLLERLRRSSAAARLEPMIVALSLVIGEEIHPPHEIAVAARDIAASIHLFSRLFQLVHDGSRP